MPNPTSRPGVGAPEETSRLISSHKVEGTSVYGADREEIGSIAGLMVDKQSGQVCYAVLSRGGTITAGRSFYPVPWQSMAYDRQIGGYHLNATREQLKDAPRYGEEESPWEKPDYERRVCDFYGVSPR